MGRPRTGTSATILEVAERLLMQRGYHGFSYQHIAETLGVKPPAIHYHFRTKSELVVAIVERYGACFDHWAASLADVGPAGRLGAYLDLGRIAVADGRVCALASVNAQFSSVPDPVRDAVRGIQARMLQFYAEALEEGRAAGEIEFAGTAQAKAAELACAVVGAQGLSRALGPDIYEGVVAQLSQSIGIPIPTPAAHATWRVPSQAA